MSERIYTISDPRAYSGGPKDRQEFFERIMRVTPLTKPPFFRRVRAGRAEQNKMKQEMRKTK